MGGREQGTGNREQEGFGARSSYGCERKMKGRLQASATRALPPVPGSLFLVPSFAPGRYSGLDMEMKEVAAAIAYFERSDDLNQLIELIRAIRPRAAAA